MAKAAERVAGLEGLKEKSTQRLNALEHYVREYRQDCWPVNSLWSARLEMCQWRRETLDKESIWDEVRSTSLSRW